MGEILADGIACIAAPSLEFYEKDVPQQIALHAHDFSGEILGRDGAVRQGLIGFVADIHGNQLRVVNWVKETTVQNVLGALIEKGWLQPVDEPCADGAHLINVNRLKRLLDVEETKERYDLYISNDMDMTAEQQREHGVFNYDNPLVDPFVEMADCVRDGDFETHICDDLTPQIDRLLPTVTDENHDFPPERWTNAIDDWELCVCENKAPASWEVNADETL